MSQKKEFSDLFDDGFEVTYEEDPGWIEVSPEEDTKDQDPGDETIAMETDAYDAHDPYDAYDPEEDQNDGARDGREYAGERNNTRDRSRSRRKGGRRRGGGVPLAAPIRKGGRALSRLTSALVRGLTAILILAVSAYVTWTFYRASTPYGDILEAVESLRISRTLAAYLCAPALFLLFEFTALCWSMTRVRVRDSFGTRKEDTGRGLFSFILVFALSYLCFLLSGFLPESPEILFGIKGAVTVYGSMHNVLLGLCGAGVVSCLIRKYLS